MNKKLLPLLWFSLVVLAWCTTKDMPSDTTRDTVIQTWEVVITTGSSVDTGSLTTWEEISKYDGYAQVYSLDQSKFWQQRIPEEWLVINDKNWKWMYYSDRNWMLIGAMGIQAADVFYGYISWDIYMDLGDQVIQLSVDGKTYISYYPQLKNPNYTGTGTLQVQDKRKNYQICKDGYSMEQDEVVYDREKYEGLLEKNPIRCFGEDKTYIYGRRQYGQWEWSGYELMRIKK